MTTLVTTLITTFKDRSAPEKIGLALTGIILVFLLSDALPKIVGAKYAVKAVQELGFPAYQVHLIGWVLLICTVLWIVPRTAVLGALGLTAYLGGAVSSDLRAEAWSPVIFAVGFGLLIWAALILRRRQLLRVLIG